MDNNFELIQITAGKCYDFLKKGQDRVDILYSSLTGFAFMFYLKTPSADEIREFSRDITVHLAMIDDFVQFLFEIGNMPVMDCSFHIKMQEGLDFSIDFKPLPQNEGYVCRIILADADTGRVEHLRMCSTTHEFAEYVRKEMIKQSVLPFERNKYMYTADRIARKYPTPAMLLPKSVISFSHKRL